MFCLGQGDCTLALVSVHKHAAGLKIPPAGNNTFYL
jgi:hypothetical protein